MKTMTATTLARNLSKVLDELSRGGEEIAIERNKRIIGRLVPGPMEMTAMEMVSDAAMSPSGSFGPRWQPAARAIATSQRADMVA